MAEITRLLIVWIGVDLAKCVIHVHGVDAAGRRVLSRAIKRDQFLNWWVEHLSPKCLIAMEACSGAHGYGADGWWRWR